VQIQSLAKTRQLWLEIALAGPVARFGERERAEVAFDSRA
jgi:hypothetical protein